MDVALIKLQRLVKQEPELNMAQAAERVGISRERVRQLANKHDLPFYRGQKKKTSNVCDLCNKPTVYKALHHRACTIKFNASPEGIALRRERDNKNVLKWQRTNRKKYRAYQEKWRKEHPEKIKQYRIKADVKRLRKLGYTVIPPE